MMKSGTGGAGLDEQGGRGAGLMKLMSLRWTAESSLSQSVEQVDTLSLTVLCWAGLGSLINYGS